MTKVEIHTIILPKTWTPFGFKYIVKYLELLWLFIWRDVKIRYKQTFLGVLWVLFNPLVTMLIITIFFGMVIRVPSSGLPYPIFFLSAYVVWVLFYEGILRSHTEIVNNGAIITKVYFPRIIIPLAGVIAPAIDFAISFIVLICLIVIFGVSIAFPNVLIVPLIVLWATSLSFGIGSFFSALHVKWRDIKYMVAFATMGLMYSSPIIYPSYLVPLQYHWIYYMSPIAWLVDLMRYALFDIQLSSVSPIPAIIITVAILIVGTLYFEYCEPNFADLI